MYGFKVRRWAPLANSAAQSDFAQYHITITSNKNRLSVINNTQVTLNSLHNLGVHIKMLFMQVIRMDTPISLENHCFLHIICHLEDYPLHHLAKLSYPVRRRLLQNLPACDIIELENACVADGIGDLENEVWKQRCAHLRIYIDSEVGPRRSFFAFVWRGLFSRISDLRKCLFSVPKCLGLTSFTSVACDDLGRLVPHRYGTLCDHNITSRYQIHAWVISFLNKAGFKPTKMDGLDGFAIDVDSPHVNDLSVLLSALDTVELDTDDTNNLSIIKAVCMNKNPTLRSLIIRKDYDHFAQMCISLLLEASFINLEHLHYPVPISDGCRDVLVELLSGQANMKELQLFGNDTDYELSDDDSCVLARRWVACVGNLVTRPDFELFHVQLTMRNVGVTQCAFTALLDSFLSAPASKQKKVIANYFDVKTCECYAQEAVKPCTIGDNSLEFKEATFAGLDKKSLLDPILTCLSNFTIQLKRLVFECYVLEDANLFAAVFSCPTFAVCEVRFWWVVFPVDFTSESDYHFLDVLLSKPSLKVFEFSRIGSDDGDSEDSIVNELKMVTNALTKQASVGTLESFTYDEFEASFRGISGDEEFVRALLCLPQFLKLDFSLQYPRELADMANELWVECANGRTLKPPPPNCTNSLLEAMLGLNQ